MSVYTILLVVLILMLVGALPAWRFHDYGYGPSGALGVVAVVLLILLLLGKV
jgi:hypothetical protein